MKCALSDKLHTKEFRPLIFSYILTMSARKYKHEGMKMFSE